MLSESAQRYLDKLDSQLSDRIKSKLKNLEDNPVPSDAKFMGRHECDKIFRYRLGDYRALYKIKDAQKIVLVSKIDKRPRVYNKF